jgi:flagellar M-ring protein FliF
MNFAALLKDKKMMAIAGGAIAIVVILIVILSVALTPKISPDEKVITEKFDIVTTPNLGQAIEIQALLAREGINVDRVISGSKSTLSMKKYTLAQKDRAIIAIVQNGIMDKNIGLEIFDKGDFTSSKEDKRIRLARAINGELSRLIKKITPIEDASVFVSIPDNELFTDNKKPTTATVQVKLPSDGKLDRNQVKTIQNLLIGSVQGLEAGSISISDTNGNVYSNLISPEDNIMELLEENDQYMKNKVIAQLDRLIGKGKYVVTVSTYMRQAPQETNRVYYDPKTKAVTSEQRFNETLGDNAQDINKATSAVSTFVPSGVSGASDNSSSRKYLRSAAELQYGVSKTQVSEIRNPGMIEEISIAVTLDSGSLPPEMNVNQLKELVARAANPKVNSQNVEIAFSQKSSPFLMPEKSNQQPQDENPLPWVILLGIAAIIGVGLYFLNAKLKQSSERHQQEINALHQKSEMQNDMIKKTQADAVRFHEEMQRAAGEQNKPQQAQPVQQTSDLKETIEQIKENLEHKGEEKFGKNLKSWIETTG